MRSCRHAHRGLLPDHAVAHAQIAVSQVTQAPLVLSACLPACHQPAINLVRYSALSSGAQGLSSGQGRHVGGRHPRQQLRICLVQGITHGLLHLVQRRLMRLMETALSIRCR
jgi:hypothetical protein